MCNSVTVGEGIIVRDCRRIGRIDVMCNISLIDYSVNGECGGGRDSEGTGKVRRRG
jgi:hypothetical protein